MELNEWLGKNNQLGIDIWNKKYKFENENFEEWLDRISGNNEDVKRLIKSKKFLFGGRTLSNRGIKCSGSYFNCYSAGYVEDDYEEILETAKIIGMTYKSQGGQGVSLSKLRPKGTPIGSRFESDGIVPFMEIFNTVTKETSQGGSRKGALMISLDIRHKEADTFMKIKSQDGKIEKANLSLEIDDETMESVELYYNTGEKIVLHEVREYSGHKIEYDVTPIDLYKSLVKNCYEWADPAALFTNRFRNYNLMEFVDEYQIETCNPCGEQPMPKHFCCNLGSMNMSEYVINPFTSEAIFNFEEFTRDIAIAIQALDLLIDENKNNHPIKQQMDNSLNYRNLGLGTMGFASALMKLGIKYGSEKSKEFTDNVFKILLRSAVIASVNLAQEKGSFPKYDDKIFDSTILKNIFLPEELNKFKTIGIRNCSLISIAPNGSISTLLGESGGCEPEFAIKYTRKTESLNNGEDKYYDVYCKTASDYIKIRNEKNLPDYFISSQEINWKDRIDIQAIMQKYVDTAISSTINLPNDIKLDDVEKLYLYAWKSGLKGITIYRDGCNREGILNISKPTVAKKQINVCNQECSLQCKLQYDSISPTDKDEFGETYGSNVKRKVACGNLYINLCRDVEGNMVETFINTSKGGICQSNINAISRLISTCLRSGVRVEDITDAISNIKCPACTALKAKGEKIESSCPDAIAKYILEKYEQGSIVIKEQKGKQQKKKKILIEHNKCPECGEKTFRPEGGCNICSNCGFSKCD